VIGGLDNLANFDELDVTRTSRFCALAAGERSICYRQLGLNLRRRTDEDSANDLCAETGAGNAPACVSGVHSFVVPPRATARAPVPRPKQPPPSRGPIGARIEMRAHAFDPRVVTIEAGEAVTFVNVTPEDKWPASNPHPVHTLYPGFDAGRSIIPGGSWSFTFTLRGRWTYHDHLSPDTEGVIVVR
jgi:plastocyanin